MKIELYDAEDFIISVMDVSLYMKIRKDGEYVHCFDFRDMNFNIQLNEKILKGSKMLVDGKKFIEKDGRFIEYKEEKTSFKKDNGMIEHESYYDEKAKNIDKGFSINLPPNLKINEDGKKRPMLMLEAIEKFKQLKNKFHKDNYDEFLEKLFIYYGHACSYASIGDFFSNFLKESLEKVEKDMKLNGD